MWTVGLVWVGWSALLGYGTGFLSLRGLVGLATSVGLVSTFLAVVAGGVVVVVVAVVLVLALAVPFSML